MIGPTIRYANHADEDFTDGDFTRSRLTDCDFTDADFTDADFTQASASNCDFDRADFVAANLANASLTDCNFTQADFTDAILTHANLTGANLTNCDLTNAGLTDANLTRAILTGVKGLPEAPHVPDLAARILAQAEAGKLDMRLWHTCETTHCMAGWAIHFAGIEGYDLESQLSPSVAGALIFRASGLPIPDFNASDDDALDWLREHANTGDTP